MTHDDVKRVTRFTEEEVRAAIAEWNDLGKCRDLEEALEWAASEYLKAREVLEKINSGDFDQGDIEFLIKKFLRGKP
jgi:hypothetical protein